MLCGPLLSFALVAGSMQQGDGECACLTTLLQHVPLDLGLIAGIEAPRSRVLPMARDCLRKGRSQLNFHPTLTFLRHVAFHATLPT